MLNSTQAFIDPLERWVKAVREDNFEAARMCAQQLVGDGKLLAGHPEFHKCFTMRSAGFDPQQALAHLCQFLLCATDGRAGELKHFISDNKGSAGSEANQSR